MFNKTNISEIMKSPEGKIFLDKFMEMHVQEVKQKLTGHEKEMAAKCNHHVSEIIDILENEDMSKNLLSVVLVEVEKIHVVFNNRMKKEKEKLIEEDVNDLLEKLKAKKEEKNNG